MGLLMNKKLSKKDQVLLFDEDYIDSSNSVSKLLNLSSQAVTFVNDALTAEKPVLIILPSKTSQVLNTSVFKPRLQNDFASLMRQVEREVYR
jgi:hypothetical protein